MNYQRIYDEIINNALIRGLDKNRLNGYYEKHHIIPKCLSGSNEKSNLVLLTGREHYLCHYLLWKIYKDNNKLMNAIWRMIHGQQSKFININSKQYEDLKMIKSNQMKEFNKTFQFSDEAVEKIKQSKIGKKRKPFTRSSPTKETIEKRLKTKSEKTYVVSEETKRKISKGQKNRIPKPHTEETKQKMRGAWEKRKLIPVSEETKKKMSESHKKAV